MADGLNRVTLLGNVGNDPEFFEGKTPILKFSLATSKSWKTDAGWQEKTTWHRCVLFGKRADGLNGKIDKGQRLLIEGEINNGSYDDKDGNKKYTSDINVSNLVFQGKSGGGGSSSEENEEVPPF